MSGNNVSKLIPLPELSAMLASRIDALCHEILPRGKKVGAEWCVGSFDGEPGTRMKVHLSGAKAGVWSHFAAGVGGDALELVAQCLFDGNKSEAAKWSRNWLGLEGDPRNVHRARERARRQQAIAEKAKDEVVGQRKRKAALGVWLSAQSPLDTPVEDYLLSRSIDLRQLRKVPSAIRFHPELYDGESQRYWPAMIAAVHDHEGFLTIHRTFLEVGPGGRITKAPLDAPKKAFSSFKGGSIRLARGYSGKPLAQAPADDRVALCEGIEDGLIISLAVPKVRVLASVALNNMASVKLPDQIKDVLICPDNDAAGSTAAKAIDDVTRAHLKAGRRVTLVRPPEGSKDFNDYYAQAAKGDI